MDGSRTRMHGFVVALSIIGLAASAFAHSGATGVVKQRMDAMGDIADQMKLLGGMIQQKVEFDKHAAANAASTIAMHATEIPELFPENSTQHPSEALETIWKDWAKFEAIAESMGEDALALSTVATGAEDVSDLTEKFGDVARRCKSCHESFRLKK